MRKDGFYWVKSDNKWVVAEFENGTWMYTGDECAYKKDPYEIDEIPIESHIRLNIQNGLPLSTLKETLADFPDSLVVTRVSIEMHNKYSIQITEFNVENNGQQKEIDRKEDVQSSPDAVNG